MKGLPIVKKLETKLLSTDANWFFHPIFGIGPHISC